MWFLVVLVFGGWCDVVKGEFLFLGGGDARAYEDGARFMDVMGAKRWFVGDSLMYVVRVKLML